MRRKSSFAEYPGIDRHPFGGENLLTSAVSPKADVPCLAFGYTGEGTWD